MQLLNKPQSMSTCPTIGLDQSRRQMKIRKTLSETVLLPVWHTEDVVGLNMNDSRGRTAAGQGECGVTKMITSSVRAVGALFSGSTKISSRNFAEVES